MYRRRKFNGALGNTDQSAGSVDAQSSVASQQLTTGTGRRPWSYPRRRIACTGPVTAQGSGSISGTRQRLRCIDSAGPN